ncbi:hypothetical protein OT109_19240 [Phycisphaeraceae bacterium D3-23]
MTQDATTLGRWMRCTLLTALTLTCVLWGSALHADNEQPPSRLSALTEPGASDALVRFVGPEAVWGAIETELESSPWLSNADEFAAWVDETGNDCQAVTTLTAEKLRELDYLLNEHWVGKRAADLIVLTAGGVAAADPVTGVGVTAAGVVFVIETSDQWTESLATNAEELGAWIESATEPWEDYADAYNAAKGNPSAETIAAYMEAAQALKPYLEKGERLIRKLDALAAEIEARLDAAQQWLEAIDHWSVEWLADNADEHAVGPALAELRTLRPKLQLTQGRLMVDQALVATMPLRYESLALAE